MSGTSREIQELLVDYAGALRDGGIPVFLRSLTRKDAEKIGARREFWDAAEIVQFLNGASFADKAVTPNVGLFISRVDAEIESRIKKAKAMSRTKRPRRFASQKRSSGGTKPVTKTEDRTKRPPAPRERKSI